MHPSSRALILGLVALAMSAGLGGALESVAQAAQPFSYAPTFPTGNLAVHNDDGSGARSVPNTAGGFDSSLSPSGQQVVYVAADPNYADGPLYIVNLDGSGKRLLYSGSAQSPDWSPDGKWIVFTAGYGSAGDIKRVRTDGTGLTPVVSWSGIQSDPSYSPDGSRVAFRSQSTPEGLALGDTIYQTDLTGQGATRVTLDRGGNRPSWGKGNRIVFESGGFDAAAQQSWSSIESAQPDGSDVQTLVRATDLTPTSGWLSNPSYSPDGSKVIYQRLAACAELYVIAAGGGGANKVGCGQSAKYAPYNAQAYYESLLTTYAPILRYNQGESFFADAADEMTSTSTPTGPMALKRPGTRSATVLATATGTKTCSKLQLLYLGATYGPTNACGASGATDFLDIPNNGDSYASDYQRMIASNPNYANIAYGRAVQDGNGTWWLQYWFFYYHNPFEVVGIGVHEGDWEMMQIRLSGNVPDLLAFAQHTGGGKCEPSGVQWDGTHPFVYVARGSHATYPEAGYGGGVIGDTHYGDGLVTRPAITLVDDTTKWLGWAGRWGASDGTEPSPQGPRQHSQWADPASWASGLSYGNCPPGAYGASQARSTRSTVKFRPNWKPRRAPVRRVTRKLPILEAEGHKDHVVVTYSLRAGTTLRRRKLLVSIVPLDGTHYSAVNRWVTPRPNGAVRVNYPLGGPRYRVTAQVYGTRTQETGASSQIVHRP